MSAAVALALPIVRQFEGLRLHAYPDPASDLARATPSKRWGFEPADQILDTLPSAIQSLRADPWTIGYGATGPGIGPGVEWSIQDASDDLVARLTKIEADVNALLSRGASLSLNVDAKPHQIAALISFAYNVGTGALADSTLLRKLRAKDVAGAAAEFDRWNKAGGHVLPGLVKRRAAERALFERKA